LSQQVNIKPLVTTLSIILFIGIVLGVLSFLYTIFSSNMQVTNFCFTSDCIKNFSKKIEGVITIFSLTAWLLTSIATVGAVLIALLSYKTGVDSYKTGLDTYKTSVDNSNLTNHIAHLNMFRDFINGEMAKRNHIHQEKVNIYKWYNIIFPQSRDGLVIVSDAYYTHVGNIKEVIERSNGQKTNITEWFDYKKHQEAIIEATSVLGLKVSRGPKNIFFEVECQVFELIDCVNITFSKIDYELADIKRLYS
jgi:hypothetical protein